MHKRNLWHHKKRLRYKKYLHMLRVMDTRIAICRAVDLMGGPVRTAARLGLKNYQTVQHWCETGRVPARYCPVIERETVREIRCEQLCPDVEWAYLRGTQSATDQQEAA